MNPMDHPAVVALRQFADPANWADHAGCVQWIGKRHPIDYAEDVLVTLTVMCTTCKTYPSYGGRCSHILCPFGLDAISMFLRSNPDAVP